MSVQAYGIFGYKGNVTIVRITKGKNKGALGYVQLEYNLNHIPHIIISTVSDALEKELSETIDQTVSESDRIMCNVPVTDISISLDRLEIITNSVSFQFMNAIDFCAWKGFIQWSFQAVAKISKKIPSIKIPGLYKLNEDFLIFKKYFTVGDWRKTVQINNRILETNKMHHYMVNNRIIQRADPLKHCASREEINKQFYLQSNWQNPKILPYVKEVDIVSGNAQFHVYVFGKYYRLMVDELPLKHEICIDWMVNMTCCCQYIDYDGNGDAVEMSFSVTINSFNSNKKEMLAAIYKNTSELLHKYCTGYLQIFESIEDRMDNYFRFITRQPDLVDEIFSNHQEREFFQKKCSFEEVLKYSMNLFELRIRRANDHGAYILKKQPENRLISVALSTLCETKELKENFHELTPEEMADHGGWYSTQQPNIYVLVTDAAYEVECACQVAIDLPVLSYRSIFVMLKNSGQIQEGHPGELQEYVDAFISATVALEDTISSNKMRSLLEEPENLLFLDSPESANMLIRMSSTKRLDYLTCGRQIYMHSISRLLLDGYNPNRTISNILQMGLVSQSSYFFQVKCALSAITDFLPYSKFLFGDGRLFFLTFTEEKKYAQMEFNSSHHIQYLLFLELLEIQCQAYMEVCLLKISHCHPVRKLERLLKYNYMSRELSCWKELVLFYIQEAHARLSLFRPSFISMYLLSSNIMIRMYENTKNFKDTEIPVILRYFTPGLYSDYLSEVSVHQEDALWASIQESFSAFEKFKVKYSSSDRHEILRIQNTGEIVRMLSVMASLDGSPTMRSIIMLNRILRNLLSFYMKFYLSKDICAIEYAKCLSVSLRIIQGINKDLLADPGITIGRACTQDDLCWALKKKLLFSNAVFNYLISDLVVYTSTLVSVEDIVFPNEAFVLSLETYIIRWANYHASIPTIEEDADILKSTLLYYFPKSLKK
ncbi:hypothetical protein NEAUS06_1027 [Nematocida ausubeli]|nr:hypothetical protein NEAUS06_0854 [Nematocida ausubeli]KAI5134278.1 hypothetical protein NEAUS06_1027 [Nematocida ausubeli]